MNPTIITAITAVNLFLTPIMPNALPTGEKKVEVKAEKKTIEWTVKPDETLSGIATHYYGNEDQWTTIWNDNKWIEDPYTIEIDWKLKLRVDKPSEPEKLLPELAEKIKPVNVYAGVVVTPQPQAAVSQPVYTNGPLTQAQIQFLGNCESGMTATRNSGNGYYGAFQFSIGTWNSMGTGYARADLAPLDVQIDAVQRLVQRSSIFGQFPGCSSKMRSLGLI
jgi:hypothetical protein